MIFAALITELMLDTLRSEEKKMKILVPTDFSGSGVNAAALAIKLFQKKTDAIILENVFQTPKENRGTLISIHDIIANDSKALLEKERRHLKAEYKDVNISIRSEEGNLVDTIKRAVKKNKINLLVVGVSKHGSKNGLVPKTFIEQPEFWPMLTVPLKPLPSGSKELILIVTEGALVKNKKGIADYLQNINMYDTKTHNLEFTTKDKVEKLKADIRTLLEKHKIGLIIFNTSKGDRLQKALIAHQMDSVLFSIPSLLINEELK